jgi:hypothetical protein
MLTEYKVHEPVIIGKYKKRKPPTAAPVTIYPPHNSKKITALWSRLSKRYIENAVRPGSPYPRLFILSAISIAFSNAHVTIMDSILIPCLARLIGLPCVILRPAHLCVFATTLICDVKRGTNRRDIDKIKDNAGMMRPKIYINLSLVITAL